MNAPYLAKAPSVTAIMGQVLLALLPGITVYVWLYGPAILTSLAVATVAALATEAAALQLRGLPKKPFLLDLSVVVTAWLLALSLPPTLPWWITMLGTVFAVAVAKHLYGGLGQNPFNPAMVGFAFLIVSFPAQVTQWPGPAALVEGWAHWHAPLIGQTLDAMAMATPLDTLRTQLPRVGDVGRVFANEAVFRPGLGAWGAYGGAGEWLALAYLAGGVYLVARRIAGWRVPLSMLLALAGIAALFHALDPTRHASAAFHLATGGAMLGAFFIATDPVSGPQSPRGQLIFGAGIGLLTWVIRSFGGYPDGVAFAVLIFNLAAPLIDVYTRPPVFGRKAGGKKSP